jgi:Zn-dependent peptidase ImmA (M78 family)
MSPEAAAEALRHYWGLGEQPIKNLVHLLEANGVRVFSLAIDAREVDAFSLWSDGKPFVFLNTQKSPENSRFDAAHELGHLILHCHGQPSGQEAERAADAFASAFLMPAKSMLASRLMFPTVGALVRAKRQWGVSVAALNYRLHTLRMTTEWTNRSLSIQITKLGYRTAEPNGIPREISQVWEKVFLALRKDGLGKADIARDLFVSVREIDELTYGLLRLGAVPEREIQTLEDGALAGPKPALRLVK